MAQERKREGGLESRYPIQLLLTQATERLRGHVDNPRLDAELLLAHLLGKDRVFLYTHPDFEVPPEVEQRFWAWIERRREGYPVAYLIGYREFYGRPFLVREGVLIPRPETEHLVERALAKIPPESAPTIIDVGCGSGAIAITLALERPQSFVVATDLSQRALSIARENRLRLDAGNVALLRGRWLEPFRSGIADMVVSNPPYVAAGDPYLRGEIRFEPPEALVSGPTGLEAYEALVPQAFRVLKRGGWLLLEHGFDQAEAVAEILRRAGFREIRTFRDLQNLPRVSEGRVG